jgi:hypothetical protein
MKQGKSPVPDGLWVELFQWFYDLLKKHLLRVIEESQRSGKILESFNSMFSCLIPKKKDEVSFSDFKPIP